MRVCHTVKVDEFANFCVEQKEVMVVRVLLSFTSRQSPESVVLPSSMLASESFSEMSLSLSIWDGATSTGEEEHAVFRSCAPVGSAIRSSLSFSSSIVIAKVELCLSPVFERLALE